MSRAWKWFRENAGAFEGLAGVVAVVAAIFFAGEWLYKRLSPDIDVLVSLTEIQLPDEARQAFGKTANLLTELYTSGLPEQGEQIKSGAGVTPEDAVPRSFRDQARDSAISRLSELEKNNDLSDYLALISDGRMDRLQVDVVNTSRKTIDNVRLSIRRPMYIQKVEVYASYLTELEMEELRRSLPKPPLQPRATLAGPLILPALSRMPPKGSVSYVFYGEFGWIDDEDFFVISEDFTSRVLMQAQVPENWFIYVYKRPSLFVIPLLGSAPLLMLLVFNMMNRGKGARQEERVEVGGVAVDAAVNKPVGTPAVDKTKAMSAQDEDASSREEGAAVNRPAGTPAVDKTKAMSAQDEDASSREEGLAKGRTRSDGADFLD